MELATLIKQKQYYNLHVIVFILLLFSSFYSNLIDMQHVTPVNFIISIPALSFFAVDWLSF